MKTNRSARRIARTRPILLWLAVAGIAGLDLQLSQSLAARFGQVAAFQARGPQVATISLDDLMAAAR